MTKYMNKEENTITTEQTAPEHIAIIMDGNGRWARERGLDRSAGHSAGVKAVRQITEECVRLGVKYLTLYTFSTENWNRPAKEVEMLMNLFVQSMEEDLFMRNNVRMCLIGDKDRLSAPVRDCLQHCVDNTSRNTRMTVTLAISYSSRWEITDAVQQLARKVADGQITPEQITEDCVSQHLQTSYMPDPDLLIRTGGELRISNYLLWQCAYSEFYFCDTYWPDFSEEDLHKAIHAYYQRQRRYGKTGEQVQAEQEKLIK